MMPIVTIANARAKMNFRFFRNASAIGAMGVTSLQQEGGGVDPGILIEKTAEEGRAVVVNSNVLRRVLDQNASTGTQRAATCS